MAEPKLTDIEASAVRQATGSGRMLADTTPLLILEGRPGAATLIHALHRRPSTPAGTPQRARENGASNTARPGGARKPADRLCTLAAFRNRDAVRPMEPDRRGAKNHRPARGHRRSRPCRADQRPGRGKLPL